MQLWKKADEGMYMINTNCVKYVKYLQKIVKVKML